MGLALIHRGSSDLIAKIQTIIKRNMNQLKIIDLTRAIYGLSLLDKEKRDEELVGDLINILRNNLNEKPK